MGTLNDEIRMALLNGFPLDLIRTKHETDLKTEFQEVSHAVIIDGNVELTVTAWGLMGTTGTLPVWVTDMVNQEDRDGALRKFLDQLAEPLLKVLYHAWERAHPVVQWERNALSGHEEVLGWFADVLGLFGTLRFQAIETEQMVRLAKFLLRRNRSLEMLENMLSEFFDAEVVCDDRSESQKDSQCKVLRVSIGPLDFDQYHDLLPGQVGLSQLLELVRYWIGPEIKIEVKPIAKHQQIPEQYYANKQLLLGWNTWFPDNEENFSEDKSVILDSDTSSKLEQSIFKLEGPRCSPQKK